MTEKVKDYLFVPSREHKWIPIDWKNNNSESMNHLLKVDINWEPQQIVDLIDVLRNIHTCQFNDLKRCIHGEGNYELADHMRKKFFVDNVVFNQKDQLAQEKLYDKFLCGPKIDTDKIISSDKMFEISSSLKKVAKKPNQKTSVKTAKTKKK